MTVEKIPQKKTMGADEPEGEIAVMKIPRKKRLDDGGTISTTITARIPAREPKGEKNIEGGGTEREPIKGNIPRKKCSALFVEGVATVTSGGFMSAKAPNNVNNDKNQRPKVQAGGEWFVPNNANNDNRSQSTAAATSAWNSETSPECKRSRERIGSGGGCFVPNKANNDNRSQSAATATSAWNSETKPRTNWVYEENNATATKWSNQRRQQHQYGTVKQNRERIGSMKKRRRPSPSGKPKNHQRRQVRGGRWPDV